MSLPTIAAIATPIATSGGLGVVRLSGDRSEQIAEAIFQRSGNRDTDLGALDSHRLYYGRVVDDHRVIDEVLLTVMRSPRSFTGEDVVEFYAHGGPFVLKKILSLLLENGAEPAGPGEFTRRAFINGKIDLTQAEAVADIIEAESDQALTAAAAQITGSLKADISRIRERVLSVLAEIDAAADVEDDEGGIANTPDIIGYLTASVLPDLDRLIFNHEAMIAGGGSARVVIAGAPNVGKSTLLNLLLGRERAIVTNQPGTTRDTIDGRVVLKGRPFLFVDTAGLRPETDNEVEQIGMDRARQEIDRATVVLLLVDAAAGVSSHDDRLFDQVKHRPRIVIANKIDLPGAADVSVPGQWREAPLVKLSAKTGEGLPLLEAALLAFCPDAPPVDGDMVAPNARHKRSLADARQAVVSAIDALRSAVPSDIVAIDLRTAWQALGEIVGDKIHPDILDQIFKRFCVGK